MLSWDNYVFVFLALGAFLASAVLSAGFMASSTMASNAAGSAIAISLSILRFRAMPAFDNACMNRLYRMPLCRQAAVIRVIHNALKLRLRLLRSRVAHTSARNVLCLARRYRRELAP